VWYCGHIGLYSPAHGLWTAGLKRVMLSTQESDKLCSMMLTESISRRNNLDDVKLQEEADEG